MAPIYYFFHYVQSPQENFAALDNRLTNMAFIKTFFLGLILAVVGPVFTIYNAADITIAEWAYGAFWYLSPIYLAIFLRLSKYLVKDTTRLDRLYKPTADLPYLRAIYGLSITICASFHIYTHLTSTSSFFDSIMSDFQLAMQLIGDGPQYITEFWNASQLVTHGATIYWLLLNFADLKAAKRLQKSWFVILATPFFTSTTLGLNASLLVMWAWREEVLATKQEMDA